MDKILRPEIGYVIRTLEEVEKFLVFLLMHAHHGECVFDFEDSYIGQHALKGAKGLPYTVKGVNPVYGDIFITEAELAQAEAEAQQVEVEKEHAPDTNVGSIEEKVLRLEVLRPEIGEVINTSEEVEKYKKFLVMHVADSDYVVDRDGCCLSECAIADASYLPYTVKGVDHDYHHIFITEAEAKKRGTPSLEHRVALIESIIKNTFV